MYFHQRLSILLISAIAASLFSACSKPNTDNNFSMPANDSTKVSPTATPTTASPTATATVAPKATAAPINLPELEIKELEPYKHRSGILAMDVPKGWKLIDKSQAGELLLTWNEIAGRATISINIFVPPSEIPENRLNDVFTLILKGMYGNLNDFEMKSPVVESTGNIVIEWTSTVTIGNKKVKFLANSSLQRRNNKLVIFTFGAIEPKFSELKDYFVKIANNQVINASLSIP
ncbi:MULTISPECIES: hypothetical protein [Pseudanabaena]|uniref:Lipoprotein n=2 Tax=Pseudanabaena TaxID=1152 RepID=L8MYK4_9CYAN|nr:MULTISPECIES: hypothetical protein [Pseudanabaena]ELS33087.1 hypothetical protein Pse7429DRAFT_1621 [Pseudanabaena biceps PCC 7429]MDG3494691.1 hypothetical protein [Pseudanabaena catenata USMAC16]